MDESFIRQRRNLLITSIIVFLISFAGIKIEEKQTLTLLGTKFYVSEPITIYICIWFMLYYFLWRYWTYFLELDSEHREYGFSIYPWGGFREIYYEKYFSIGTIFSVIRETIVFTFHNLIGVLAFLMKSLFHKNFSETLLPLLFAIFVVISSFYSPFIEKKQELAVEKIYAFTDAVYSKTVGYLINEVKTEVNRYTQYIFSEDLFDIEKKEEKTFNLVKPQEMSYQHVLE